MRPEDRAQTGTRRQGHGPHVVRRPLRTHARV